MFGLLNFLFSALLLGSFSLTNLSAHEEKTSPTSHVALTQIVEHPSLNAIRKGILDELAHQGFQKDKNLTVTYDSAQGSIAVAAQIAQRFVSLNPDVIVAITTPSAQTMVSAVKGTDIPIVFGAVTDPLSAKITTSLEKPTHNVTGTIDLPPAIQQLEMIREVLPSLQTLGILYNPGEANSMLQVVHMKKAAQAMGLKVILASATKTADVATAAKSLISKVEALLLPNDNTVVSALESVLKAAHRRLPVFASDPDSVQKGALAALANDQYGVGRETGKIVALVLRGRPVQDIPIQNIQITKRYVNQRVSQELGLPVRAHEETLCAR